MTKTELPIPIHHLAFLQAYLYEVFSAEKKCENNFKHTEWYLNANFTKAEIDEIIRFFNKEGLNCDCDIINKLDLRKIAKRVNFHN